MPAPRPITLLFHAPCFDGIVSAVLATEHLEADHMTVEYAPVGYEVRHRWRQAFETQNVAVVDFLYHPRATFWADHHPTTFLDRALKADYDQRKTKGHRVYFDPTASSCALLLWNALELPSESPLDHLRALTEAADRTDAARYRDPEEAVWGSDPALRINRALALHPTPELVVGLIKSLRRTSIADVAKEDAVRERVAALDGAARDQAQWLRDSVQPQNGVLVYELPDGPTPPNRYLGYVVYPHVNYTIALVRGPLGVKITAMRNPWIDFPSVPIGPSLSRWGGGGHERVGSVLVPPSESDTVSTIVAHLRSLLAASPNHHD